MASSSSSSQQLILNNNSSSGSEQTSDPKNVMDIRKRKRMQSNRESARRSRQRKQKHLDDLSAQVSELKAQNHKILTTTNNTTQLFLEIEAENSVLRAQIGELSNRLQSLNDIISCLSNNNNYDNCEIAMKSATTHVSQKLLHFDHKVLTKFNQLEQFLVDGESSEFDDQERFGMFDLEFDDGFSMNSWGFSLANYPSMPTLDAFMC